MVDRYLAEHSSVPQSRMPPSHKDSEFRLRREACVYYLLEIVDPKVPGAYHVAVIDDGGQVVDIIPGL